ncbi:MAG: rhodanese-like domain-containing protein, partial [Nannocystaceae bacterium]
QLDEALSWIAPPSAASCALAADDPDLARVSAVELQQLLDERAVALVDARLPEKFDAGHIPSAINLPADTVAETLQVQSLPIDKEQMVVTYCDGGSCAVSEYLATVLRDEAGCREVHVLEGGFLAWTDAQYPVEVNAP